MVSVELFWMVMVFAGGAAKLFEPVQAFPGNACPPFQNIEFVEFVPAISVVVGTSTGVLLIRQRSSKSQSEMPPSSMALRRRRRAYFWERERFLSQDRQLVTDMANSLKSMISESKTGRGTYIVPRIHSLFLYTGTQTESSQLRGVFFSCESIISTNQRSDRASKKCPIPGRNYFLPCSAFVGDFPSILCASLASWINLRKSGRARSGSRS